MNAKQILLLAFIGGAIGAAIGFIGTQTMQHKVSGSSSFESSSDDSNISELSDDDFLSKYMNRKKDLSAHEQVLGDRLYACLANKEFAKKEKATDPEPTSEDVTVEKKSNPTSNMVVGGGSSVEKSKKSKIEMTTHKTQRPILADVARNIETQERANRLYLDVFPSANIKNSQEDHFGVKNNITGKVENFLKDNVCNDPKLSMISEDQRNRSQFFDSVKENTFTGVTEIFGATSSDTKKLKTMIQFNSPNHNGMDFVTTKSDIDLFERRIIDPEIANAAWRYNLCGFSVVLVGENCSWNKKYTNEYKDLFYVPESKKLIGNIYCKNPTETKWTNVGNLVLSQSSE